MMDNAFSRAAACFFCAALVFTLIAAGSASVLAQSIAVTAAALCGLTFAMGSLRVRPAPVPVRIARRGRERTHRWADDA